MICIAQFGLLILLSLFLLLHFSILIKIIPYNLVWGGRLKSHKEMVRFEIFSILIKSLFVIVILVQGHFLTIDITKKIITYALWLMAGLFLLNTLGNVTSKSKFEQRLFTPITILLALFSLILALSNWMKRHYVIKGFVIDAVSFSGKAQALFSMTEPACNMPGKSIVHYQIGQFDNGRD